MSAPDGVRANLRATRAYARAFGAKPRYVSLLAFRLLLVMTGAVFGALDRLLFADVRAPRLDRPVFVVGHLRSGTTFLHRFLGRVPSLRPIQMWELLFPARSLRWLLAPARPLLGRISLDRVYAPAIHRTGLLEPETDDIGVAFRYGEGLLSWIYAEAWEPLEDTQIAARVEETCAATELASFVTRVHAGVAEPGRRPLSKSFFGLYALDALAAQSPQGRFVLLIRDPAEVVPSTLSMQRSVQGAIHGLAHGSALAERYYGNLYRACLLYYRRMHEAIAGGALTGRAIVVTHRQLREEFSGTMARLTAFLDLPDDDALAALIATQAGKQERRASEHAYALGEFGLTAAQIAEDFAFVYENYDV